MKYFILLILSIIVSSNSDLIEDEDVERMEKKMSLAKMARYCTVETGVDDVVAKKIIIGDLSKIDDDDVKAKVRQISSFTLKNNFEIYFSVL